MDSKLTIDDLHSLETFTQLERLIEFYINEHNSKMPHSAFAGQTPDEMYLGRGATVPDELATARLGARRARMLENLRASCAVCPVPESRSDSDGVATANAE